MSTTTTYQGYTTYRVTLHHDEGNVRIITAARSEKAAIEQVLAAECAPRAAVVKVEHWFTTVEQMKARNEERGGHFFDRDTMHHFGSRLLSGVIGGRFFVTSERDTRYVTLSNGQTVPPAWDGQRRYTVRMMSPTGELETVSEFMEFDTAREARAFAKELANPSTYVVQGNYGHGWEDLTAEPTRSEANARRREYVDNEGGSFRIVKRKGDNA